jgi:redox-sensitive bicupin YhaK (pirin superfamily)
MSIDDTLEIVPGRRRSIGAFEVNRILPHYSRRMVGPFIFADVMGPMDVGPQAAVDVHPHPHIGLSTVTYLFDGELVHHDSLDCRQVIVPGDVNWMTAGRGIAHSERSPTTARQSGERMAGVQAWVALPENVEEHDPSFHHHTSDTLPTFEEHGNRLRLIAGEAWGARSPVEVASPLFYAHAEMREGGLLRLPTRHDERAILVVDGAVKVDGHEVRAGALAVVPPTAPGDITATVPSRLMLLGGSPLGPRHIWWNFVSSSKDRIEQAKDDWRSGRFPQVPNENDIVPLPEG